jgi:SNF2 family DNA or RNA helicase
VAIEIIAKRIGESFGENSYLTCYKDQNAFDQIQKFRETGKPYIIANPSKMGVGHNIQFAHYQAFFSNSYSWIERDQAESREHRQGQVEKVTLMDFIVRNTIDELIRKAFMRKQDLSITLSQLARVLKNGSNEIDDIIK